MGYIKEEGLNKTPVYHGDTFKIIMHRYSDPKRLNAARNAAIYLGKKDRDNIRRPLGIIRKGHVAEVFKGESVEFEFVDVSKEVYDHIITYTTRQMRVAGGNRALTSDDYTLPSDRMKNVAFVNEMVNNSMHNYEQLLNSGETPQVSRAAMPTSAKLNPFVYKFNFLTLGESLFKQRIWEKGAQGNTVKVVEAMYALCYYMDKDLWDTFYEWYGEPAAEWVEVRRKLKKDMTVADLILELTMNADPAASAEEELRRIFGEQKSMW